MTASALPTAPPKPPRQPPSTSTHRRVGRPNRRCPDTPPGSSRSNRSPPPGTSPPDRYPAATYRVAVNGWTAMNQGAYLGTDDLAFQPVDGLMLKAAVAE